MIKRLLLTALFSIAAVPAFAACSSPVTVKDGAGANVTMSMATGADTNCQSKVDWDTSSQAHTDAISAAPALTATAATTNTYTNGTTNPLNADTHGNLYVNVSTFPANTPVNTAQVNGVTTSTGTGAVGTGSQRVAVGTDTATIAGSAPGTAGSPSANVVSIQGATAGSPMNWTPYPVTSGGVAAVPETISATGTTGATTATLAAAVGKTTYICGFSIRANATSAATANSTVTGTVTGTLNFTQWTAPLASGIGLTEERFSPCIPASATNTTIAVISAAPGTGGVVSVTAWGYQL